MISLFGINIVRVKVAIVESVSNTKTICVNVSEQIIHVIPLNLDESTALNIDCAIKMNCGRSCVGCQYDAFFPSICFSVTTFVRVVRYM